MKWYYKLYEVVQKGLSLGTSDNLHGCFLATKEPLLSSSKNSEPIFNPINIDKKDIIQDTFEDLESHI